MKIKDEIKKMVDVSEHREALIEYNAEEMSDIWIPRESIEKQQKFTSRRYPENISPKKGQILV